MMRRWLLPVLLAVALPALPATPVPSAAAAGTPAHGLSVIDTTPAFWRFWRSAAGRTDAVRVQRFLDAVVGSRPELFSATVLGTGTALSGDVTQDPHAIVGAYLHDVAPWIPAMRRLSATLHRDLGAYAQDFAATFPDFAPVSPVYFTVSLFSFDGATRDVEGKTALLFGIDGIARFHAPGANLKVFFDHELFHQYHDQLQPATDDDTPLWGSLWEEGLATWVSLQMNAGSTEADALMSPTLGAAAQALLPALARELLQNFDSTDRKEYAAFFHGRNDRPDLPPRCGYYVGYRVAQRLAAGRDLAQLARLQGPGLADEIRSALQDLAGTGEPRSGL